MTHLLQPITLGSIPLRNRITMGSMTRNRCVEDNKPTAETVRHYAERARDGVGLIIAEGTFISYNGSEWPYAPVMFEEDHAEAWKKVTGAVHREGGKIFFQPWHPGRIQNENMPMLKQTGYPVYAPSRIKAAGGKYRSLEDRPGHTENITVPEDPGFIVEQYRDSVRLAKEAGFDGIELLCQGGYLLHNFLTSHSNKRTDRYGGTVQNRCRFPLEVLDAIISVWGSRAVGIKICPSDDYNDTAVPFTELSETYDHLVRQLMVRDLGFVNISRRGCDGTELPCGYDPVKHFGPLVKYPGSKTLLMVNHEYTVAEAESLITRGEIDVVTFARPFIYNPDLISRIKTGVPFAVNDRGGFVNYGPFARPEENYNDWPRAT
ncbi:hypothetical protein BDV25DRAFT_128353 [Aspergillus avenaceus]|uniref:NADH:flavin oxidoreductase/NADH oxidase N-terminal domain-containing protein n=1 Tax=Aspergillus avenaceus TaxID=36643 RepID=A0A5N6U003_ASPAV|nr:hypothetical protein BDV25DRAFT_128353 [Aspergillus avenaceus]